MSLNSYRKLHNDRITASNLIDTSRAMREDYADSKVQINLCIERVKDLASKGQLRTLESATILEELSKHIRLVEGIKQKKYMCVRRLEELSRLVESDAYESELKSEVDSINSSVENLGE